VVEASQHGFEGAGRFLAVKQKAFENVWQISYSCLSDVFGFVWLFSRYTEKVERSETMFFDQVQ